LIRLIKKILNELVVFFDFIISYWPGRSGYLLRAVYYKKRLQYVGAKPVIGVGVVITGGQSIRIGNNVSIMRHSALYANDEGRINIGDRVSINFNVCIGVSNRGEIIIGNNVLIGQNVVLRANDHEYGSIDIPIIDQGHTGGKIIVEDDVWIGANAVVTRNTRIGAHSIVGAGSVVTDNIDPYSIVGGVPAKLIKKRIQDDGMRKR
jgi:galactoside O-acetyltransferase